ncbi:MAG: hypothetical protein HUK14_04970 [Muribaculaceae bacterium]|nr:hypothetical protein [Muribaculaceae bacterium]
MTSNSDTHQHLPSIDFLKAVAIIMIVVSHLPHWGVHFDIGADCGVAIFFTLS